MTYCPPHSEPQIFEFSALLGADLLQGNDVNLSCGDCFVMPVSANVCIQVTDNDGSLSGDAHNNEAGDDHSWQIADIMVDGVQVADDKKIYAEEYYVLHGDDGKCYYMVEMELVGSAEGDADDYYAFIGNVPAAGVSLTIAGKSNVCGNWLDYRDLSAGLKWTPDDDGKINIEAEDMALRGYKVDDVHAASGGEVIRLKRDSGEASMVFGAESGMYSIDLGYIDESDGEGQIEIWLNDTLIHVIDLTANDNGNGNDWSTVSHVEIDPVQIEQGDVITLRGVRDAWEMARIDNIAFCPQNNTAPVAEDDVFTVGETSSTVLDLLSNDFDPEGDDLTITLLSQPLDGMVSIDANGQVVFETGDAFQGLSDGQTATVTFEYQISDGELTDTATVTVTVVGEGECIDSRTDAQVVTTLPGGSAVTTTFTGPEVVKHDTDSFDVAITFGDITQEQYNFVFVLDVSGSTGVADSFEVGKTVLEAEIEAVKSLTASIIDAGIPDGAATISIIPFSSPDAAPGGQFPVFTFGDDGNGLLQSDIDAALDALTFAGETNYLAAIGTATDTVQNLEQRFGDANNQMYFLSDGDPTPPGSQPPFLLDIFSANLRSQAEVRAIGLGTDVSTTYLDPLDNTGGAEIALDTTALTAAINQAPESIPDIVDASLVLTDVNGATLQTFDFLPTDFEETALGYELSIDNVSGLGMFVGDTTDATLSISYDEDGDGLTDEVANIMLSLDGILPQSIDL